MLNNYSKLIQNYLRQGYFDNKILLIISLFFCLTFQTQAAPGDLDPTFGAGGKLTTDFGSSEDGFAAALQPDGKIVVVGRALTSNSFDNFAVARYNSNGTLATIFDGDGKVITPIGSGNSRAYSVVIQADGKIIVIGETGNPVFGLAAVRYNSNGSLDNDFGTSSIKTFQYFTTPIISRNWYPTSAVLQPDGKIIIGGYVNIPISNNFAIEL